MDWRGAAAAPGVAALAVLAMLGGAAAQSDGSDGRPSRPFNGQPATEAPAANQGVPSGRSAAAEQPAPRSRAARTDLPRGPKNIPWDEPGKRSGVPGVQENAATDLPAAHTASVPRKPGKRAVRVAADPAPKAEEPAPARARTEQATRKQDMPPNALGYAAPQQQDEPRKVSVQDIRVAPPQGQGAGAETAQSAPDPVAAEARAKLIEQFRAKALAEEQRRLQAEQSRDRHARRADQPTQPRSKGDPEVTGAVTAAPDGGPAAEQKTSGLKQGLCRLLLFNLVPGC